MRKRLFTPASFPFVMGFLLVLSLFVNVYFSAANYYEPQPVANQIHYLKDTYPPDKTSYCPGETMHIAYEIYFPEGEFINQIAEVFAVDDSYDIVQPDNQYTITIVKQDVGQTFTASLDIVIPNLPPGQYEYRRGSSTTFSTATVFTTEFTIPESCTGDS